MRKIEKQVERDSKSRDFSYVTPGSVRGGVRLGSARCRHPGSSADLLSYLLYVTACSLGEGDIDLKAGLNG
jgi:hypothetical protein